MAAQLQTADRRAHQRELLRHDAPRESVEGRLRTGWTPEQIAGRMRVEGARPRVCQETIDRHVYRRDGMRSELWWHLPNHRMSRRPRRSRKRRASSFAHEVSILFRPEAVAHRTEFGHWEGDLVLFQQRFGQANVISLMERVGRFIVLLRNMTTRLKPVMGKIATAIGTLPLPARKSIAFDRGSEFVTWPHPEAETGTRSWFCDAQSPHQKGAVENTNRRVRRHLPARSHAPAHRRRHPRRDRPHERQPAKVPRMAQPPPRSSPRRWWRSRTDGPTLPAIGSRTLPSA
jgi:IS30 family transposase